MRQANHEDSEENQDHLLESSAGRGFLMKAGDEVGDSDIDKA